jgi:antitoxin component YwqK of YwqJK toxin-antitoxin module
MSHNTIRVSFLRRISVCILLFGFWGCTNQQNFSVATLHEGSFTIKAEFVNNKRNGKTEIYDSLGKLVGVQNYKDNLMSGLCIHYYPSGVVSDSVHYECDKPQGYWKHYNKDGSLKYITYFYFGLRFGPELWYRKDRVLENFTFFDFDGHALVECSYNSHGHIDSITKMALPIVLDEKEKNGNSLIEFFAYLPEIPLVKHTYFIGVSNDRNIKKKLYDVQGSNFFIDTLLDAPLPGDHFYLGCNLKAIEGGIDTTVITEAIKK